MKNLLCIVLCLMLAGCALIRQTALDVAREEVKNAETACEVAGLQLEAWPPFSGAVRKALDVDQLPKKAVDAMDELDELARAYKADPNSLDGFQLGGALGLRIKILSEVVKEAIKTYAPDILELVPAFL